LHAQGVFRLRRVPTRSGVLGSCYSVLRLTQRQRSAISARSSDAARARSGTPGALVQAMLNDQYQLGELLGRGGMGQVHAARHRSGRLVAVKRVRNTLSSDRLMVDRLSDEARL